MSSSGRFPAEMMMMPETYVALLLVSNRLIQLNRIFVCLLYLTFERNS